MISWSWHRFLLYVRCSFPKGAPWVWYHGSYKGLHIDLVLPGMDAVFGKFWMVYILISWLSSYILIMPQVARRTSGSNTSVSSFLYSVWLALQVGWNWLTHKCHPINYFGALGWLDPIQSTKQLTNKYPYTACCQWPLYFKTNLCAFCHITWTNGNAIKKPKYLSNKMCNRIS